MRPYDGVWVKYETSFPMEHRGLLFYTKRKEFTRIHQFVVEQNWTAERKSAHVRPPISAYVDVCSWKLIDTSSGHSDDYLNSQSRRVSLDTCPAFQSFVDWVILSWKTDESSENRPEYAKIERAKFKDSVTSMTCQPWDVVEVAVLAVLVAWSARRTPGCPLSP